MKQTTDTIVYIGLLILIAATGFFAGYTSRRMTDQEIHAAFVEGQRDITAYVENCTIELAHEQRCVIPCRSERDCVAKNGTRDNY